MALVNSWKSWPRSTRNGAVLVRSVGSLSR